MKAGSDTQIQNTNFTMNHENGTRLKRVPFFFQAMFFPSKKYKDSIINTIKFVLFTQFI